MPTCIVGAGLTGLWTAYYLAEADPGLQIVVCEQRFAGYGASGRNGGWLTGALAGSRERFEATHGRAGVLALQEAMHQAVDEVIAVCAAQGIDADLVKGGELQVATSPAQLHRVRAAVTEDRRWGLVDTELLDAGAVAERVRVSGALGGSFTPHCARLHPVKLVAGLATLVRGRGVAIYEQTPVTGIEPGLVRTAAGTVHAPVVLRATEGFTARLPGLRRTWLPMNSSLVVTEPLEADVWAEIGWPVVKPSATPRTVTATPSAPRTVGSRSAGEASPTGSVRGSTPTVSPRRPRWTPCSRCCTGCFPLPPGCH